VQLFHLETAPGNGKKKFSNFALNQQAELNRILTFVGYHEPVNHKRKEVVTRHSDITEQKNGLWGVMRERSNVKNYRKEEKR